MCRQIMQIIGIVKPSLSRHIKNPWTQYTLYFGSENKSTFRKVRIVMQLDIAVSRLEYNKRDYHDKIKVKTNLEARENTYRYCFRKHAKINNDR